MPQTKYAPLIAFALFVTFGPFEAAGCPSPGLDPSRALAYPTVGDLGAGFGMRIHPILNVARLHTGQDFTAPLGTPVSAVDAGTVVRAEMSGGNGLMVMLDHGGGAQSAYTHLKSASVRAGDCVQRGTLVGEVGATGIATGPHLHFEILIGGAAVDPMPYFRRPDAARSAP